MKRMALIVLAFVLAPGAASAWEQARNKNGVRVFNRPVPGSSFKEFRAVAEVKASLNSLVAVVSDADNYCAWYDECKEARRLGKDSATATEWTVYYVQHAPFPVSDRDMILHGRIEQDGVTKVVTVTVEGEPGAMPAQKGRVRVPVARGLWRFTPLAGGRVQVEYQMRIDPGGSVPAWLAGSTVTDGPLRTVTNFIREAQKGKYAKPAAAGVAEPDTGAAPPTERAP
jgi:hypothetical protein